MPSLMRVQWASRVAVADGVERVLGAPPWAGVDRRPRVGVSRAVVGSVGVVLLAAVLLGGIAGGRGSISAVRAPRAVVVPLGLQAVAQRVIGASDRGFWVVRKSGVLVASGGGISSEFGPSGVRVRVAGGMLDLRLVGVGYGARLASVSGVVAPVAATDSVRYRRGGLVEWYRNGPLGLEQGFTLARRPAVGEVGPLTLALAVDGSLIARQSHAAVVFVSRTGRVRLRYGDLVVTDATGRRLRAALMLSGGRLLLRVWDRGGRYPLRIDPFIQQGTKLVGDCTSSCGGANGTGETASGQFGISLALSSTGDTALIGAWGDDNGDGSAWVFTRTAGAWSQQGAKLVGDCTSSCGGPNGTGESGAGEFGLTVALSGDGVTALIGADTDNSNEGAAWVFTFADGIWSQQGAKLVADCISSCNGPNGTGETGIAAFGDGVALSSDGNTALIGGDNDNGQVGAAWVFTRTGSTWSQQGSKLVGDCTSSCSGPNGTGETGESELGRSVALSGDGDTALVGAANDNSGGAVWVFTFANGVWSQQGTKLVGDCASSCSGPNGTGETGNGGFGLSVALSDNGSTALVGGPDDNSFEGAAWVFTRTGSTWSQQGSKLVGDCTGSCNGPNGNGETGDGDFGASVALSGDGNTALIGADDDDSFEGAAWVFTLAAGSWSQQGTKLVGDCASSCSGSDGTGENGAAGFAGTVSLSGDGNTALIGGYYDNARAGAAWVFAPATSSSLTVVLAGSGSGSVSGSGISCPGACSESLPIGSAVTLTAMPAAGSTFAGWNGGCSGTGSCQVELNSDTTVTATFSLLSTAPSTHTLSVVLAGSGSGSVKGSGISCPSTCSGSYAQGSGVTLTATPAAGSKFVGWSGGCAGTRSCALTINADMDVTATFNKSPAPNCTLTVQSNRVLLATPTKSHKSKVSVGTLSLAAECDQAVTGTLAGVLTELVGKPPKHGKQRTKSFDLGPVGGSLAADAARTFVLKLPNRALKALTSKAKESVSLTFVATDAQGTGRASAGIARLKGVP